MKSIALEQTSNAFRLMVFVTDSTNHTTVADVAESDQLVNLAIYLIDNHSDARAVRIAGVNDEPDCLTVWEAAAAAMVILEG